jgi:hypothetical protein
VDPSSHNPKHSGVFEGSPWRWGTGDTERDAKALNAIRRYIEQYGAVPNQDTWPAAGLQPSEKTIRRRFGSFNAAIAAAVAAD